MFVNVSPIFIKIERLGGVSSFKNINTIALTLDKEKGNKFLIIMLLM